MLHCSRDLDDYWEHLTPERAFLARVFVDHCVAQKDNARLENVLPVVTALAFRIQAAYNDLIERIRDHEAERLLREGMEDDDEERARREEELMDGEFVIGELLRLAVNLDYADEIGRRKMFQLVRKSSCLVPFDCQLTEIYTCRGHDFA